MWRISTWLVDAWERVRDAVIGHNLNTNPKTGRVWCGRCKWKPKEDQR